MRSAWTHVICTLLVVGRTQALRSQLHESERKAGVEDISNHDSLLDLDKELKYDLKNKNISVLPPIFLFEYTNGTNVTNDDKSKRTIDGVLGYGFQSNNINSGHYNYYFPAGKSGTSVSIEESISPFLPKTIVEPENNSEIQYDGDRQKNYFVNQKSNSNSNQELPHYDQTQAFFRQRTKLLKTSADLETYQEAPIIPNAQLSTYTTESPGLSAYNSFSTTVKSNLEVTTYSGQENNGLTESSTPESLLDITPAAYRAKYRFRPYSNPRPSASEHRNPSLQEDYYSEPEHDLSSYPKYSVENGVKYEHKIVWKYPDGRVSDTPPTSYVTYSKPTPKTVTSSNFQTNTYKEKSNFPPITHNYNPSQAIYSQKPAQFLKDDTKLKSNQYPQSAFTDSNYESGHADSPLPTHKIVYQNSFNMKPGTRHRFSSNLGHRLNQRISYNSAKTVRPISKYAINSPNPEYIETTENPGKIDSEKVTNEAQDYFNKMYNEAKFPKNSYGHKIADPQYDDLLKYNPSISQYIKNPSSILNAQPTFVQAGNSLIPVIILRVDGAPPVRQKATPNINLKALLQQYLTQYAQSLNEMSKDSSYDLGNDYVRTKSKEGNPISDLTEFTQNLSQYSNSPDIAAGFQNKFTHNNRYDRRHYQSSNYVPIIKQGQRFMEDEAKMIETVNRYTSQGRKAQKIKNVEIIDDPRYTTYHRS
ncbi:uncharacterized protein LOC122501032 [Leptopilina heterotoma]|uniref:uncharacterized protein LOC122501032 n=1 Tax=Leptopilina heterotoma TaxID=63436 RepID=UPI001CA9EA73|nr:uncharacterized protein LOC122501032 [Leptopilina heterotoma]